MVSDSTRYAVDPGRGANQPARDRRSPRTTRELPCSAATRMIASSGALREFGGIADGEHGALRKIDGHQDLPQLQPSLAVRSMGEQIRGVRWDCEHRDGGVRHDLCRDRAEEQATHAAQRLGAHHDQVCAIFPTGCENFLIRLAGTNPALDRERVDPAALHGSRQQRVDLLVRLLFQPGAFV